MAHVLQSCAWASEWPNHQTHFEKPESSDATSIVMASAAALWREELAPKSDPELGFYDGGRHEVITAANGYTYIKAAETKYQAQRELYLIAPVPEGRANAKVKAKTQSPTHMTNAATCAERQGASHETAGQEIGTSNTIQ